MANKKTSTKQKKSETKYLKAREPFKSDVLKDSDLVTDTLLECIRTGDLESFRELLAAHIMTVNKTEFAKQAGVGRRTIYDLVDLSKKFNPELSTVSALMKAIAS